MESRSYQEKVAVIDQVVQSLGLKDLKQQQQGAIMHFISGRDVFVALPTGYGKSLIYACLPQVFDLLLNKEGPIVIVVCPLIALMEDQVTSFRKLGLSAAFVCEKSV